MQITEPSGEFDQPSDRRYFVARQSCIGHALGSDKRIKLLAKTRECKRYLTSVNISPPYPRGRGLAW